MPNKAFIYVLKDPDTKTIRYVGQTIRPEKRLNWHIAERYTSKISTCGWIQSLVRENKKPIFEIIEECNESIALKREQHWIDILSRDNELLNKAPHYTGKTKRPRLPDISTIWGEYLTIHEAAVLLDVCPETIRKRIKYGLPAQKGSYRVMIHIDDLMAYKHSKPGRHEGWPNGKIFVPGKGLQLDPNFVL